VLRSPNKWDFRDCLMESKVSPVVWWEVVPQLRTGSRETPVTEFVMCSRHEQLPHVIGVGPQWVTTTSDKRQQSSAKYVGAAPTSD